MSPAEPALDAFHAFYLQHHVFVASVLRRFGIVGVATEDALQDAFVTAYRRFEEDADRLPRPWLYGIARRVASNHRRSAARRARRVHALAETGASASACSSEPLDAWVTLRGALASLSSIDRELFFLAEVDGLTGREIAEALALNPNTVYWRIRMLRQRLALAVHEVPRAQSDRASDTTVESRWARIAVSLKASAPPIALEALGLRGLGVASSSGWAAIALGGSVLLGMGAAAANRELSRPEPSTRASPEVLEPIEISVAGQNTRSDVHLIDEHPRVIASNDSRQRSRARSRPRPHDHPAATALTNDPIGSADGPLAEWNGRLLAAMQAMQIGAPQRALELTATGSAPSPALDDLRIVLHIEALCELDRPAAAHDEALAFIASRPASLQRPRVAQSCALPTTVSGTSGHRE